MTTHQCTRLSKYQRRDQLLAAALEMVSEQGTEGLTLVSLAHRVGITHTVVYRHFETRAGLLIALCQQVDGRQVETLVNRLKRAAPDLHAVARAISHAYMASALSAGKEWFALLAALKSSEATETVQRQTTEDYLAICKDALAPYSSLPPDQLHLRCTGILGAAQAIANESIHGHSRLADSAACLTDLIVSAMAPGQTPPALHNPRPGKR
ncbi:TetR/AcrR family transcriptional regulator [Pseudomonas sp. LFM046]|uniref:TetR/AcrR family transcriptional regulator n=1 Tax=Pseudomonas sp. LFM046 TaxID=1608357 RepID=UPI0005CFA6FB|nr:TetR/AcrR family transcriptional regulator [Pseudomonas sp. LFM046]